MHSIKINTSHTSETEYKHVIKRIGFLSYKKIVARYSRFDLLF